MPLVEAGCAEQLVGENADCAATSYNSSPYSVDDHSWMSHTRLIN